MSIDAILPAGGRISGDFARETGTEIKALIALCGRTLLERTLATLRATGRVGRIVVIGPREVVEHPCPHAADAALMEAGSGPANIVRGMEWLWNASGGRYPERILIITTDLPFLTAQAVTGFLDACPADVDVCLPLTRRREFEAGFPGLTIEYVRLRDGQWTMGCAFLVSPTAIANNRAMIERAFAGRKSQIAMVRLLGPLFIVRFLARRLTVADIERRGLQLLGCTGAGIRGCAPELALDIDQPQDYHYALLNCRR